jgi:heme exporter protein C
MRERIMVVLTGLAAVLLVRNLYVMLVRLPDEMYQGAIYRIIFFHVPAAWTAFLGFFVALVGSALYLATKNLRQDALAVAATEVSLAFAAANLITGMIWGRIIWGIWWTWDPRLTSMLVCVLLYAGYLMLRGAMEDPTARARASAVLSIIAFVDVPIVFFSIRWWRTQHPQPVVYGAGKMDPAMMNMLFLNWVPVLLLAVVMVMVRLRQEEMGREVDALRRQAHAL